MTTSKKLRDQYVQHVTKMLTLLGEEPKAAGEHAKKILALETSLAQASRTKVELRDPQKNYNKMKTSALQALTPDFKWDAYFKETNLPDPGELNVGQPDFFKGANKVFASTPIDDLERIFPMAFGARDRGGAFRRFRQRKFQLLRNDFARNQANQAALETSGGIDGQFHRRSAGKTLCCRLFPARIKSADAEISLTTCDRLWPTGSRHWNGWTTRPRRRP